MKLDEVEKGAVTEFVNVIDAQGFSPPPLVLADRIHRTREGHIIVPVSVKGRHPSHSLALLMNHKTDQLYKQTFCRVRLAQCPLEDPHKGMYLWAGEDWQMLSEGGSRSGSLESA